MSESAIKIGMVFAGGGRRGAFQVGILKALSQIGIEPSVIAGTSIGALNGAVVASSSSMRDAVEKLESLWLGLNTSQVIQFEKQVLQQIIQFKNFGLFDSNRVEEIIKNTVDIDSLIARNSKEFYVGVYPTNDNTGITYFDNILQDLWRYLESKDKTIFLKINELEKQVAIKALMASAAFPIAFKSIKVGDNFFRDGGMGDRLKEQGNVPFEPLIKTKCTHCIIASAGDGSLWNRFDWKSNIIIYEIRPSKPLHNDRGVTSLFDFNPTETRLLIEQGLNDTLNFFNKQNDFIKAIQDSVYSEINLIESLKRLE
ncbi:patatin-like phospholipase family protein [Nostoc sp. UHCC 0870]|uniref:patatin-like phospholipase family protein n=1 Tax=Nostoc sp. UHCC 0870 TaxID=2914041 RepID=UPI001EE07173|nr:patatin-like phospholipase family protein [Nostoc sp. UHCC 0870]UKP01545.1 patatin-like phospholipase family protein [Nostoc sp. UHCC 0870]